MKQRNMLSGEFNNSEDEREITLRPRLLADFQGQQEIKDNLSVFIKAALNRKESLDHVFISGPPGLGKTTLAGILAHEMGVPFKVTSAPAMDKPKDLAGLLTTIEERTVFFIDEIHRLKPAIEEMLYVGMEDFELDWIIGQGPSARTIRIPVPPFTLIGATTKAGQVASPLYSRFGITLRINFYGEKEIQQVIRRSAGILDIQIDEPAVLFLAKCSRGTPRVANRLLKRMRDFAEVLAEGVVTLETVKDGLDRLDIDNVGLESHDREILRVIIENYGGGPVGAETLAISIGEGIESLEDFYEPFLIQRGLLKRTPRGRMATPRAYKHLGLSRKGNENQGILL